MVNAPEVQLPAAVQMANVIGPLVPCLSSTDVGVVSVAVDMLKGVLDRTSLIKELGLLEEFRGIVAPLRNLLASTPSDSVGLIRSAVTLLFDFTQYEEEGVAILMEGDVLPVLVPLLSHQDDKVLSGVMILIFGILHKGANTEDLISKLLEVNFLAKIPGLVGPNTSKMTKEFVWNAFNVILQEGNRSQYEILTDQVQLSNYLGIATQQFLGNNLEMKLESGILLVKLWGNGLRHGFTTDELTTRFSDFGVTEDKVLEAVAFEKESGQTILMLKFARALNL